MRSNYWSCSKFADWLRGTEKPVFETGPGWNQWRNTAKARHQVRYWIAEEGLDKLQNFIYWPVDRMYSVKYYVVNRWIDQCHALVAHPKHVKPGQYRDLDFRILHCLFDELVDFVEIEKAYSNYRWDAEKQEGMKWWQVGRWRTRTWRSAEAGLQHLEWETTLTDEEWLEDKTQAKPTRQAETAKEIIALYKWWTEVYPNVLIPWTRVDGVRIAMTSKLVELNFLTMILKKRNGILDPCMTRCVKWNKNTKTKKLKC